MAQFSYKARRRSGEVVTGVLEVADRPAALVQIERLGLFPVSVDATRAGVAVARGADEKRDWSELLPVALRQALKKKRKPRLQELAMFTQQLANLLNSGMPLTVALNSMTHLETKGIPAEVSRELKQEVMEGRSLSDAMAKQPAVFTELFVNMVRAGESSGQLVDVLRRLADYFKRFAEVQSKFKSAMIYPVVVVCFGVGIAALFAFKILPTFMDMFTGFNMQLPLPTRVLLGASDVVTRWWWLGFLAVIVAAIIFKRFQATEEGKRKLDEWRMKLPIFGKVVQLNLYGQFARVLATLLKNGVPVLNALKITEQIIPNRVMKEAIAKTRDAVTDGKTLAQPLAHSKVFPQLMVDLVKIGEDTGDVPGALTNLADTYENELQTGLQVMMSLLTPIMTVVMAIFVGFLLISILLPMFQMISNISESAGGGK
jgi:type II secretory pathway component PulF